MYLNVLSARSQPFCLYLNVLKQMATYGGTVSNLAADGLLLESLRPPS